SRQVAPAPAPASCRGRVRGEARGGLGLARARRAPAEMAQAGGESAEDLEKLTVAQLKDRLKEAGLPVSGKKADLVSRLMDQVSSNGGAEARGTREGAGAAEAEAPTKSSAAALAAAYEAGLKAEGQAPKAAEAADAEQPEEVLRDQEPWDPALPEPEEDAAFDSRPKLTGPICFMPGDSTLNVLPSRSGSVLMSTSQGGLQHLVAGARASVGVTTGRYMFEAMIVENSIAGAHDSWHHQAQHASRHWLRIGVSTAGSAPIMGDTEESICYDSNGSCQHNGVIRKGSGKFHRGQMVAIVLNLKGSGDADSTISLFVDGKRFVKPQKLPQALVGKPLFPTVTFRGVTLHVHFGPEPRVPLTFACRPLQDAALEDTIASPSSASAKSGTCEVIFPVCLPDEGTFDWLDWHKQTNPDVVELSDRSIVAWAQRSGAKKKAHPKGDQNASTDRPDMAFDAPEFEDGQVKQNLTMAASVQKRSLVVMEVRENLLEEFRRSALAKFRAPHFKRVALVLVGEPPDEFKKWRLASLLKEKQERVGAEYKAKVKEHARKKVIARARRKAEVIKKKMEKEERKKQKEEERRKAAEDGMAVEEPAEEEEAEEEEEPADDVDAEDGEPVGPPPQVQLTEQEMQWPHAKIGRYPDIVPSVLAQMLPRVSLPTADEGFDEIRYGWLKKPESEEYLRTWQLERKQNMRMEDIKPSHWFNQKLQQWKKDLAGWHAKRLDWDDPTKRSAMIAASKESSGGGQQKDAGKKFAQDDPDPLKTLEEGDDLEEDDIFGVEDVCDAGKGKPMFADFEFADWALLSLRFELHLLIHAFVRECGDPDRTGVHPDHLSFYYGRFFKKGLNPKIYGCESVQDMVGLVRDTVILCRKVLESQLHDDLESNGIFVKLTEACRQERQRRIDTGDQTAQLKVQVPTGFGGGGVAPHPKLGVVRPPMPGQAGSTLPVRPGGNLVSRPRGPGSIRAPAMVGKGGGKGWGGGYGPMMSKGMAKGMMMGNGPFGWGGFK
ncbi:unnamed protein product, partial [Prorocentrum cordatum]